MMKTKLWLSFLTLIVPISNTQTAIAQTYQPSNRTPVADSTLNTQVSGNGSTFNITGGLTKGQTLFHSFTDFSVPTNGAANFVNLTNPRDIITRVTGNNFSDINGLINSNGANFFLINPNGVTFGTNAQLNVGRAFMATTAEGINLVDAGGRAITFGTNTNGDAPLLSVAPNVLFNVSSLSIGRGNGQINNFGKLQNNNLNLSQYIGLIGGDVNINRAEVIARGGKIELGGLASPGNIAWSEDKVTFPVGVARSNVTLTEETSVSVAGNSGGSISINAQNLNVLNGSEIVAGILTGSTGSKAGNIEIDVLERLRLGGNNQNFIANNVFRNATGDGGNVTIKANELEVKSGSQVFAATSGFGNAGNLNIDANNILVDGENPNLSNGSLPSPTVLSAQSEATATGKAGNLTITTKILTVSNGGKIQAATFGKGDGGNLFIKADEINIFNNPGVKLVFDTSINTGVSFDPFRNIDSAGKPILAEGKGGNITIDTDRLSIRNGGNVSSGTQGIGNAGDIKINASKIEIIGETPDGSPSGIFAQVEFNGIGKAGTISLTTKTLNVSNGGKVQAATFGKGDGGNLFIKADDINVFDDPGVNPFQLTNINVGVAFDPRFNKDDVGNPVLAIGKGGNLNIEARRLILKNGAAITSDTKSGQGGNMDFKISDYLLIRQGSYISASAGTAQQGGNGGNIKISSPLIIALPKNSDITANAYTGQGGKVTIASDGLFGIGFRPKGQESNLTNDITASSTFGQNGTVNISTPGTDPGKDTTQLPTVPTDASNQISQVCSAENRQNKLTVTGRGGLPPNANDPLTSDVVWQDARATSSQPAVSSTTTNPVKIPPPAVGWVFDGKGKVTLIAAATQGQPTGTRVVCPNVK